MREVINPKGEHYTEDEEIYMHTRDWNLFEVVYGHPRLNIYYIFLLNSSCLKFHMHVYSSVEYVYWNFIKIKIKHKIKYKRNKTLQTKKKPGLGGLKP